MSFIKVTAQVSLINFLFIIVVEQVFAQPATVHEAGPEIERPPRGGKGGTAASDCRFLMRNALNELLNGCFSGGRIEQKGRGGSKSEGRKTRNMICFGWLDCFVLFS